MNYSIEVQADTVVVDSWASSRRKARGLAIGALLVAIGGTILYLRLARDVAMSLAVGTSAASLLGYGLARIATDLWLREHVVISADSASRTATLLGLPIVRTACELSRPVVVSPGKKGVEIKGASFSFGRYLSREDAASVAKAIDSFLRRDA